MQRWMVRGIILLSVLSMSLAVRAELKPLRVTLDGNPSPTTQARFDGKELFITLDILQALGCRYTLDRREESVTIRTRDGVEREVPLTRLAGLSMVSFREIAGVVDVTCHVVGDECQISTRAYREAQKKQAETAPPPAEPEKRPAEPEKRPAEPPKRATEENPATPPKHAEPEKSAGDPGKTSVENAVQKPDELDQAGENAPPAEAPERPAAQRTSRGGVVPRPPTARIRDVVCEAMDPAQARLRILADGVVTPRVAMSRDEPVLVVDIPGGVLDAPTTSWAFSHPLVAGVQALSDAAPNVLRLLVRLSRLVTYRTRPVPPDGYEISVRLPKLVGRRLNEMTVVIDPGHGGPAAPGCSAIHEGQRIYEKNLTLSMARKVRERLVRLGINAVLTRTEDVAVSLAARPRLANDMGADLFLSIHVDFAPNNSNASGTTAYYHGSNENGRAFAHVLARAVSLAGGLPNRGARSDMERFVTGMAVLRTAEMPAVLLEVAFLSNPGDRAKLVREDFQNRVADAIAEGIKAYVEARIPGLEPVTEETR